MASGPITSWEIDAETVETVSDLIFWGTDRGDWQTTVHGVTKELDVT